MKLTRTSSFLHGDAREPIEVERIAEIELVRQLCTDPKGRAIGLEPGDFACVTGPLMEHSYDLPRGVPVFEVFMDPPGFLFGLKGAHVEALEAAYRRAFGLMLKPAPTHVGKEPQLVSFALPLAGKEPDAVLRELGRFSRAVIQRADQSMNSPWRVVSLQAENGLLTGEFRDAADAVQVMPLLEAISTVSRVLPEWDASSRLILWLLVRLGKPQQIEIELLVDTFWRGGFKSQATLPSSLNYRGAVMARARCRMRRWAYFLIFPATDRQEAGPAKQFDAVPVPRRELSDSLRVFEGSFRTNPELRQN